MTSRIALSLGSGGARGYAHIGVIEELESQGHEIVGVAGTSMGALVGGLYAAGKLDEYSEWARSINQRELLRLLDVSWRAPGAIRGERIFARVQQILGDAMIEDFAIPFTAVATDLLARKEVWFQRGRADVALRASIALPTIFTPVMLNGRLLADGGMLNPLPIAPLSSLHADAVVAVDLTAVPEESGSHPVQETAEVLPESEWRERFRRTASQVLDADVTRRLVARLGRGRDGDADGDEVLELLELADEEVPGPASPFEELPPKLRTLEVMELSLDALQSVVARYRLAGYPPDLTIRIPKNVARTLDFHRAAEVIEIGRAATKEALAADPLP